MTGRSWRWMDHGPGDGAWNMATDEALLHACESGRATLRLYGWRSPTVSVGYSQNAARDLDLPACVSGGVAVVRRSTGGRAVWHCHEVTYSVVAPVDHPEFSGGLRGTFRAISHALLSGLRELGVPDAALNGTGRATPGGNKSPACFAALNHCEIAVGGRKLVGSAQRRTQTAFLQHGSILLRHDPDSFLPLLRFPDRDTRREARRILKTAGVGLDEILKNHIDYSSVSEAILKGFMKTFPGDWEQGVLNAGEASRRDTILKNATALLTPAVRDMKTLSIAGSASPASQCATEK